MKILKATVKEIELVAPLFDQYRQFYKCPPDLMGAHKFLKDRLAREESVIFFAEENKEVLGFVQLYPSFSSLSMKPLWVLNDLFVISSARRKSVGRKLVVAAQDFSVETHAKGLTLKTAIDNLPAQKLYESLGWKLEREFLSYIYL